MNADATYQTQNYEAQGGSSWVIGATGTLDIIAGGKITNAGTQASAIAALTDSTGGAASTTIPATNSSDSTATNNALASLTAKVNALIAAVKGVGITG